jgi:hypothetical protein
MLSNHNNQRSKSGNPTVLGQTQTTRHPSKQGLNFNLWPQEPQKPPSKEHKFREREKPSEKEDSSTIALLKYGQTIKRALSALSAITEPRRTGLNSAPKDLIGNQEATRLEKHYTQHNI